MLPSSLSELIEDQEIIVRFLTQRGQFNKITAKPAAFMPDHKSKETSVSRHGPEPSEMLWELGRFAAGDRTLYGATFITAGKIRGNKLDVFTAEPPPRHAAIRNWPWEDDPEFQKAKQKDLALGLASDSDPLLLINP